MPLWIAITVIVLVPWARLDLGLLRQFDSPAVEVKDWKARYLRPIWGGGRCRTLGIGSVDLRAVVEVPENSHLLCRALRFQALGGSCAGGFLAAWAAGSGLALLARGVTEGAWERKFPRVPQGDRVH